MPNASGSDLAPTAQQYTQGNARLTSRKSFEDRSVSILPGQNEEEFQSVLGINLRSQQDRELWYKLLVSPSSHISCISLIIVQKEAEIGYQRLATNSANLKPPFPDDPPITPPYTIAQVSESALRKEICAIYARGETATKAVYDLAKTKESVDGDNWIVRWLLWFHFLHVDTEGRHATDDTIAGR